MKSALGYNPGIFAALLLAGLAAIVAGCEGPPGPPGEGPESLSDPSVLPRVIYTYPPAGVGGPYAELYVVNCGGTSCIAVPRFQVRFNKIMNGSSARNAIGVAGPDGNLVVGPAEVFPVGGDIFLINPVDGYGQPYRGYLPIGAEYRLSVDTTVKDINGNALRSPFTMSFVPEPAFRVVRTHPENGSYSPDLQEILILYFNSRIDTSIMKSVRAIPPVEIDWRLGWEGTSLISNVRLAGSTTYTVVIDTPAADAAGHPLPLPYSFSFASRPFSVQYVYPADGQRNVSPEEIIEATFSEQIDSATIEGSFHISPPVDGYMYLNYRQYLSFHPRVPLEPSTTYTIQIDTTLRSATGVPLPRPFRSTFTTAPPPQFQVNYTSPADGETGVYSAQSIRISTNQAIDTATVAGAFHIDPPVAGRFTFQAGVYYFYFDPAPGYPTGGLISVTIDTSLTSASGQRSTASYAFSFRVRPLAVDWVFPQDGRDDVAPADPLRLRFNGPVDSGSLAAALTIDPPTPGRLVSDPYSFRFDPANVWIPETTYTVRIDTTLTAAGGGRLPEVFVSTFRTAPFKILQYSPPNGIVNHPVNFPVWVYCNDGIDTGSVRTSFSMTDSAGGAVAGRLLFSDSYPEQFGFLPYENLPHGAFYAVTITTGFRSVHGYPIASPLSISFRTAP